MKWLYKPLLLCVGMIISGLAIGQTINKAEYFLVEDPGVGNGTPITITSGATLDQNFSINTTGFEAGLHKVHVRVKHAGGAWSVPKVRFFYVIDPANAETIQFRTDITAAEYYFDADPGPGKGSPIPLQKTASLDKNWVADTDGLEAGDHLLYIRTQSVDGFWSMPDTVSVSIDSTITCNMPVADFTFDTVDINTNIGLTDLSTNVDAGATYAWDVNDDGTVESTSSTFDTQFASRGVYPVRLTVTNPDGCTASIIKEAYITGGFPTAVSLSANDSLLVGNTITLSAPAGYSYDWNTGATTQSIEITESGEYYSFLSADGITYKTEKVNIQFFEALTANLESYNATSGMNNGAAFIRNIDADGLEYSISWSSGQTDVTSVKGLAPGSYTVTITTSLDTYSYPFTIVDSTPSDFSVVAAEYFLDADPGPGQGTPISIYQADALDVDFSLDLTGYEPGIYKLYTRAKSAKGTWSIPKARLFYVIDPEERVYVPFDFDIVGAEYYFDKDPGIGNGNEIPITASKSVDVDFSHVLNNMEGGLHEMYVRTQSSSGAWSTGKSITFFVIGGRFDNIITFKTDIVEAEYFFDEDPGIGKGFDLPLQKTDDLQSRPWAAKTDGLALGEHTLNIRTKSQDGVWNTINTQTFTINDDTCVPPQADFAFDTVGVDVLVGLTDLSTGLSDSVSYAWDIYGDGIVESTSPDFDTTFAEKGVYPVKLTVVNYPDSCFTSVVKDIYIIDGLPGEVLADKTDTLLVGDSITYTAPDGYAYEWNTGDSTQSITVGESGRYFVWLTADGISYKSKASTVNFFEPVTASIDINGTTAGRSTGAASLNDIDTDGLPYTIEWSTGILDETAIYGLSTGTYQVKIGTLLDTAQFTFSISNVTLQGTEIIEAEYFIAQDPGPGNGTPLEIYQADEVDFRFSLDVSELEIGLHRLYLRTRQANGFWGIPKIRFFYVIDPDARVYEEIDRNIVKAEYFIDEDPGIGMAEQMTIAPTKVVDQNLAIETNGLSTGLHYLYVRTQQNDGVWSGVKKTTFFVIDSVKNDVFFFDSDIVAAEYYFDEDPGVGAGIPIPIQKTDSLYNRPWSVSTQNLSQGKHKLNLRVRNEDGLWNMVKTTDVFLYPSECDLPVVDFTFDTVGVNTSIGLTDLSTNVLTGATYKWDINGDGIIESTSPGFDTAFTEYGIHPIRLTITNSEGCFTSIVKDIAVMDNVPGDLTLSGNDSLLVGETLTISAPAGYAYEWNTGDTTQTIEVTEAGTYYVYITSQNIHFRSKKINVKFFDPLMSAVEVFDATSGLPNGAARLDTLLADGLPTSIAWSTGEQNVRQIEGLAAGSYSVDVGTPLETTTLSFDVLAGTAPANSITEVEYYIDTDPGPGLGNAISTYQNTEVSSTAGITFTDISEGPHSVFLRAKNDQGVWGPVIRKSFYILSSENPLANLTFGGNIVYAEYAFDSLPDPMQGVPVSITAAGSLDETLAVDISSLEVGDHKLYIQVQDESGNWSMRAPETFTICNSTPAVPLVDLLSVCPGENVTFTVNNPAEMINWYDGDGNLLQSNTSATYSMNNVQKDTSVFVSHMNAEGCESALTEVAVDVIDVEIYAGPDVDTYSYFDTIELGDEFPGGGTWSGTYVDAQGIFRPKDAGTGAFDVTYTLDSGSCTLTDVKRVNVRRLDNDPPLIEDQQMLVDENALSGAILGTLVATDQEGDPLTFYGLATADTTQIGINATTGEVFVKDSAFFNFELNQELLVDFVVSDPFYESTAVLTISIQDVNEAPLIADQTFTISENEATTAEVGTLIAADPENEALTFSIVSGNELGAFSMSDAGVISVLDSTLLDFELNPSFTLTVEASDGSLASSAAVNIAIQDSNEAPLFSDQNLELAENPLNGSVVATLDAVDPEGVSLSFSIISGNESGTFEVNNAGELIVADSSAIDFETNTQFLLEMAVDDGLNIENALITVSVTDVNEAPIVVPLTLEVNELTENGTQIGELSASDPENQVLTFDITSGNTSDAFAISESGIITVNNQSALSFGVNPIFNLQINVSDGELSTAAVVQINLIQVILSISETDSSALASLYESTDGANWTNNSGWTTSPIAEWFGVKTDGAQITSVMLSGNNLNGVISEEFLSISSLDTLDVSNNNLTDIPDLHTIADLSDINISGNKLQFGSLQLLVQNDPDVIYAPQQTVLSGLNIIAELNTTAVITRELTGSANTYSWFKNGEPFTASGPEINIQAESFGDEGVFYAEVTNELVPDLTLTTAEITLKVSSLERDRLALLAIYEALNGASWSNGSDWPSTEINAWEEVTIQSNRVTGLNLSSNNASGDLPEDINDLLELTTVDLSSNHITGLPEITLSKLSSLDVSNNNLEFDDLEPNVDVTGINYANQELVDTRMSEVIEAGSDYTLNLSVGGSSNKYTWRRTNDLQQNFVVVNNASESVLSISDISYETMGTYRLTVTSDVVSGLTLTSKRKIILASADLAFEALDLNDNAFTAGTGFAFRVTVPGTPYDTIQEIRGGADIAETFLFDNLILGDYLIAVRPDNLDEFLTTYYPSTDLWSRAKEFPLRNDSTLNYRMAQIPPPLPVDEDAGVVQGTIEAEFEGDTTDTGDRILARKRVKRAACSMRRYVGSGRTNQDDDDFELYAYVESDEEGRFRFENIEAGLYRFNIEYPGIPMDPKSFVEFEVGEDGVEKNTFTLEALVTEEGIKVENIEELGFYRKYFKDLDVYPNPANKVMTVRYAKLLHKGVSLRIVDLMGRTVLEEDLDSGYNQEMEIDVSDIPDGVYMLNFIDTYENNQSVTTYRISIRH